jgi:lia operon protein LiaG
VWLRESIAESLKNLNMKYILPFCMAFFFAGVSRAQEFKVTVENTKDGKLVLDDFSDDLPIEGYSGNEIVVTPVGGRFEAPEQAKGLKPVYAAGTDNTGVGVYMEKNGNHVTLRCLLPITKRNSYRIRVPENLALEIERDCAGTGHTIISNVRNEIDFQGCHDLDLKNVSGPLVISTISGGVNVAFSELSKDRSISIATVSGSLDVTLPAKAAFNLEMGTVSGSMYSDFDLQSNKDDMRRVGGGDLRAQVNGGGVDVKLTTVSGSIYLRKG